MEIANLEAQLTDILVHIDQDSYLLCLKQILSSNENVETIKTHLGSKELLETIQTALQKSMLPTNLYYLIKTQGELIHGNDCKKALSKAILDIRGNFVWFDKNGAELFEQPARALKKSNLFQLIDRRNLKYIYLKYGKYLLQDNKPKIITYGLKDSETILSSRCSLITYNLKEVNKSGFLLETRRARHSLLTQDVKIPLSHSEMNEMNSLQTPMMFYTDINAFSPSALSMSIDNDISSFNKYLNTPDFIFSTTPSTIDTFRNNGKNFFMISETSNLPVKRRSSKIVISEFY